MKLHTLIAIAASLVAAPLFAQTQLEKSVGAPAGAFSTAELIQIRNAMEQDNRDASELKIEQLFENASVVVTRNAR